MPVTVEAWSEYNVTMTGACAALAGLVIVAASVNIGRIIEAHTLVARLAAAIAALVLALVTSGIGLIPAIDLGTYGFTTLLVTAGALVFQINAARRILLDQASRGGAALAKLSLGFLPIVAYAAAAGFMLAAQSVGLLFAALGCLLAIVVAILMSWIALVEVLR